MFVLCSVYSYSFVVCRFRPHTGHGSRGVILRHEGGAEGVIFLRYTRPAVGQPSGNKDLTPVHTALQFLTHRCDADGQHDTVAVHRIACRFCRMMLKHPGRKKI